MPNLLLEKLINRHLVIKIEPLVLRSLADGNIIQHERPYRPKRYGLQAVLLPPNFYKRDVPKM